MKHKPKTLEELKATRRALRNINIEHYEKLSKLEKLALLVTEHVGTMGFFLILFSWSILWIAWNLIGPAALRFDPFPAFVLWLFISNLIQLMLLPLLMVGQNLQGKHSEARAQFDFEINLQAEKEIEIILQHLENQSEILERIVRTLEEKKTAQ